MLHAARVHYAERNQWDTGRVVRRPGRATWVACALVLPRHAPAHETGPGEPSVVNPAPVRFAWGYRRRGLVRWHPSRPPARVPRHGGGRGRGALRRVASAQGEHRVDAGQHDQDARAQQERVVGTEVNTHHVGVQAPQHRGGQPARYRDAGDGHHLYRRKQQREHPAQQFTGDCPHDDRRDHGVECGTTHATPACATRSTPTVRHCRTGRTRPRQRSSSSAPKRSATPTSSPSPAHL
jgi:hypothetical protein